MDIIQFFLLISDESYCVELLRRARWSGLVTCPHCNCNSIKRYGRYKICFQRYFCYRCRCTFNDKTGTVFHYSHIPLSKWFCHIWLFCISSLIGTSIRQISKSLEMQYRTSYHMTRKIMQKLFDSQKALTINGECEADELYVHAGMKGKSYHDKIMESGRLPRRRAIKPPLGRGRFSRDFPMVMCYHQRGGDTILEVPQNYPSIAELVCSTIQKGSRINTDEYSVYDSLQQRGFEHHCAVFPNSKNHQHSLIKRILLDYLTALQSLHYTNKLSFSVHESYSLFCAMLRVHQTFA